MINTTFFRNTFFLAALLLVEVVVSSGEKYTESLLLEHAKQIVPQDLEKVSGQPEEETTGQEETEDISEAEPVVEPVAIMAKTVVTETANPESDLPAPVEKPKLKIIEVTEQDKVTKVEADTEVSKKADTAEPEASVKPAEKTLKRLVKATENRKEFAIDDLVEIKKGRSKYTAKIKWAEGDHVGVQFLECTYLQKTKPEAIKLKNDLSEMEVGDFALSVDKTSTYRVAQNGAEKYIVVRSKTHKSVKKMSATDFTDKIDDLSKCNWKRGYRPFLEHRKIDSIYMFIKTTEVTKLTGADAKRALKKLKKTRAGIRSTYKKSGSSVQRNRNTVTKRGGAFFGAGPIGRKKVSYTSIYRSCN